jgi:hypothetical protein
MATASLFPLEKVTENQVQPLGQALWSWSPGKDCNNFNCNGCDKESCIARRSKRLTRFFDYYRDLTALYEPDDGPDKPPALKSHDDLFRVIKFLKSEPDIPRRDLVDKLFSQTSGCMPPSRADQEHAVNLAVRIMFMVNCSAQQQNFGLLEHGIDKVEWLNDSSLAQFIADIFPVTDHPSVNDSDSVMSDMKTSLRARKLKKVAGLKFRPTDDLRNHLKLDHKAGVVDVFHFTTFLKEHLRLTKDTPCDISVVDCLKR